MWIFTLLGVGFSCVCILLNILELCLRMQLWYLKTVWSFQGLLLSFVRWARAAFTLVLLFSTTEAKSSWVLYLIPCSWWGFSSLTVGTWTLPSSRIFGLLLFGGSFFPVGYFLVLINTHLKTWKETSAHFWSSLLSVQLSSSLYAAVFSLVLCLPILAVLASPNS